MSLEADTDSKLIELVEQFPGLYDKSSADHKNPETISTMWEIISRKLKLPRYECEGRWKYLRKRFTQTNTTWKHHNSLTFLEPFIKRRKLLSNNLSDIKDDEVMIIEECEDKKFYIPLQCEKKRKMIDREDEATFVQSFREKNPEEDSVRSFCNSISSDLLKLSSHEMLNCRIDILTVIQKYMLRMNDDSSGDTLVPELMKHFAEIENKIMQQKMTAHDKDWVILYTIKNLFSKMMDLQKHNADLHELLRNFQSVEQMKKKTGSVRKETNELRSAFVEQTSNRASVRKETNELRSAFVEQTSNRASVQNGNSFLPAALVEPANTKNGSVPSEKNFLPSAQVQML
ncbi:hypothetical protein V9T40_011794 [Parthenolecanium corni]|uniref:MADF domain-containing protein n=1 Tax=Parthenolecanium corni TaxID=536013 RepID=A0AAN9XZV1_9HEMI